MNKLTKNLSALSAVILFTACSGSNSEDPFSFDTEVNSNTGVDLKQVQSGNFSTGESHGSAGSAAFGVSSSSSSPLRLPPTPSLEIDRIANYVGNKVTITADYYRFSPTNLDMINTQWQIVDAEGNDVLNQEGEHALEWTPEVAGTYTVKHTMVQENVEIIVSEVLYVLSEVTAETDITERFWTMDEKLLGTWSGEIHSHYGNKDKVSMVFYNDGTYMMSRVNQYDMEYPFPDYAPPPQGVFRPGEFGMRGTMPYPYPANEPLFFNKEKGIFELLDIWANGEALGYLQSKDYPAFDSENMKRIRFTDDFNTLFFEFSMDPFFAENSDTFILSRVSDTAEPPSLEVIKEKVIGEWQGRAMAPWAMPYDVNFQFNEDGSYQAASLSETTLRDGESVGPVSALYFGAAVPTVDIVHYNIDSFVNGLASGDIALELKNGDVVTGTLSNLEMSIDYSVMVFSFNHYGKYGPIRYVIERQ